MVKMPTDPFEVFLTEPGESANMDSNNAKPHNPTVEQYFVTLTYGKRPFFAETLLHKPAVHMQRIESVLNM